MIKTLWKVTRKRLKFAALDKSVTLIFLLRKKPDICVTWHIKVKSRKEKKRNQIGHFSYCINVRRLKCGWHSFSPAFRMIFDQKVRGEGWIFRPFCCKVWKRSDAMFGEKIAPALEPFQNKDSSLVLPL